MLPKISLLDEIRKGGYEASLITTFNAYLPFYEEIVLRRLINAGVRHNVLMMDAQQYAASMNSHPPRLAGRQYTLLPVGVAGAFHPKLIFLVGKNKGLVAIGSHNMTLSGFGFNREMTNLVRIHGEDDAAGIAVARDVWREVEQWLEIASERVPRQVTDMVLRVRDVAPWLSKEPESTDKIKVIAGRPGSKSLWEQFTDLTVGEAAEVLISGAFFDQRLTFLDRIKQDLNPNRLVVGIDPRSVQIPASAKSISNVTLVDARALGAEKSSENENSYLHAKAILVRQQSGDYVFASGSANPSAPAWLATQASGNIELMLVRRGESALIAAEEIGFTSLAEMPTLTDSDWAKIQENQVSQIENSSVDYASGLAVVDDERILVRVTQIHGLTSPEFVLQNELDQEISRSRSVKIEGALAVIEFSRDKLASAVVLACYVSGRLVLRLLLHHSRVIEEQARSGIQRKFKEALLSLNSDSPNFGLLVECLDKMLFSDETASPTAIIRGTAEGDSKEPDIDPGSGSLAIDISDTKKRKTKQRLVHTGDLAYFLDTLIHHLKYHEEKATEERDRYGRSEEEQINSDDDDTVREAKSLAEEQSRLLQFCHSKVHTVINRMSAQLAALASGKQSFRKVLVRLLGVLAVLRELRACDGRVTWVEKGQTTVPTEERLRLLEEVMLTLFEGKTSLLNLESLGEEFSQSDDVARLKGLILWLAWDCGLTMDLRKPFMEDTEDRLQRLFQNAMVLALAQAIQTDEVVIDEARQSIGNLTSSEMNWLKDVQRIAAECDSLKESCATFSTAENAEPGDIAIHKTLKKWVLRFVDHSDSAQVSLIRLSNENDGLIGFRSDHIVVTKLSSERYGLK